MSEWKEKSLAEIAANKAYAIVDGPFGTQLHASEYQQEGVPVVRVVNTTYDGRFDDRDLVYISESKANSLKRSKIIPGDVIIAKTGATIGKSGIFPSKYPRGIVASSCLKISVDTEKVDSRFVARLIESHEGQRKIIDSAGGSTRTTINIKPFSAIRFVFPDDKDEQTQIADILSMIDKAIEKTESIIEKQNHIKIGLIQDLLTKGIDEDGNIRSEITHEFRDSPLGRIPVGWETPFISDMTTHVGSGITPRGGESIYVKDGVTFIRSQNVTFEGLNLEDVAFLPIEIHKTMKNSEVFAYDVLLNITGASIGRCCYVPDWLGMANVNQHVCAIRFPSATYEDAVFLSSVLGSHIGQSQVKKYNAGGNREGLNYQQIRAFVIPWPKSEERKRIVTILDSSRKTIAEEQSLLKKLKRIKPGLIQDLLKGRVLVTKLLNMKREFQQVSQ